MKTNFAKLLFSVAGIVSLNVCQRESKQELLFQTTVSLSGGSDSLPVSEENIWTKYNYDEREGKKLFEHYCSVCHGIGGAGDGFNSYNLDPKPKSLRDNVYMSNLSDSNLQQVISLGGASMNKSALMPAYSHTLSGIEIERIVKYIRTFTDKKSNSIKRISNYK